MHSIYKVNQKVEKLQDKKSIKGIIDGEFPTFFEAYPSLTEFSSERWSYINHSKRHIDYYRDEIFWLSKQLFVSNVLAKKNGKIYADFEYYSFIDSISIIIDNIRENDILIIERNGEKVESILIESNIFTINSNYVMMLGDYFSIYLQSEESAIIQIKYRIIG